MPQHRAYCTPSTHDHAADLCAGPVRPSHDAPVATWATWTGTHDEIVVDAPGFAGSTLSASAARLVAERLVSDADSTALSVGLLAAVADVERAA